MATIWHLAHTSEWHDALAAGEYMISTRGATLAQVGFVHASATPDQVERVATAIYADDPEPLTLLGIDTDVLAADGIEVRYESADTSNPDSERFPHIYGAVPTSAVVEQHPARMDSGKLLVPGWPPPSL